MVYGFTLTVILITSKETAHGSAKVFLGRRRVSSEHMPSQDDF
jgi:hypothetical protein